MPIYQYKCHNCGANIEKMQSFSADPLVECPECHHATLKKVMQPTGIIFKGSGWYITDSKKSSAAATPVGSTNGDSKSSDSKASETTSASESKSSESKSSESKSSESKSSESKQSESKQSESKAPSPAPAASSSDNA